MKKVFTNKNFSLLFFGNLVSSIGNTFYNLGVAWFILELTKSALQSAIYIATGGIVSLLLTPFCGVIADRFNKVKIVYITDFIRGIVILGAGYFIYQDLSLSTTMIVLYVATIILSINGAFFGPAVSSLQVDIVDEEDLQAANASMSMIHSLQTIIGLTLTGLLYDIIGITGIFIINGLTFVFSGMSEIFIKYSYKKSAERLTVKEGLIDLKVGFKYLFNKRGLMSLMIGILLLNFAFVPLTVNAFPYMFNQLLKTTVFQYSLVQVSAAIGTLVGAIVIGNIARKLSVMKAQYTGMPLMALVFIFVAILFNFILSGKIEFNLFYGLIIGLMFFEGILLMYLNIPIGTAFAITIDQEFRGRAYSVIDTMSRAAIPLATLLGGFLIQVAGIQVLLVSNITIVFLIMIFFMSNKNIRGYLRSVD
ncbi:MFS transporter [Mycoplasmatota bacterium]|nr:MFS transporter [Mycoplasmatota bacterium]